MIAAAQSIVPAIVAADNADEGEVADIMDYDAKFFEGGDIAILCRNNAPLIGMAYGLLRRNVPAKVLGRDIGAGMLNLIDKMNAVDIETLITRLDTYFKRESKRAAEKEQEQRMQALEDQVLGVGPDHAFHVPLCQ